MSKKIEKKSDIKERIREVQRFYTKTDIFLSRMASIIKVPKGTVSAMFKERTVTAIRLNSLVDTPENILKKLRHLNLQLKQVNWIENTYIVLNKDKSELGKLPEYAQGLYYIQNLSSMIPALLLKPNEHEKVLDMCAAPGSKTTQLGEYMKNKGRLVANDVDTWRVQKLKDVLYQFNVRNAIIKNFDASIFGKQEAGAYDKILLDAPCSGEGLIYLSDSKSLRFWNIKKTKGLVKIQESLIRSAFNALKENGTLIYSTCTLEPEENEGIVTSLLKEYPNSRIEEIEFFNSKGFADYEKHIKRGIQSWNEKTFHKDVSKTYRILPSSEMMGFYIAKIRKSS